MKIIILCLLSVFLLAVAQAQEPPPLPPTAAKAPDIHTVVRQGGFNELTWSWQGFLDKVVAFRITRTCGNDTFKMAPSIFYIAPYKAQLVHHEGTKVTFFKWVDRTILHVPSVGCTYTVRAMLEEGEGPESKPLLAPPQ